MPSKKKSTVIGAVVLAGAATVGVLSTVNKPYAGSCVNILTGECRPLASDALCPVNFRPVVSCSDLTPAEYPPTNRYCFRQQTGECWPKSQFPQGCPLGTVEVAQCGVLPTPAPQPTIPIPPISGTPVPFPTPKSDVPCVASIQVIQSDHGTLLLIDGVVSRSWVGPPGAGNRWQTSFSYTAVPMISGGH